MSGLDYKSFTGLLLLWLLPLAFADDSSCASGGQADLSPVVTDGGFILLIIAVMISLWALALVCEDFFVPALQVLCVKWNVPDSVAGSLIMAAGNNAPELFVSFLGIFVQKSAIGIGTVFGSEIFNHMCISAGSGYFAKGGVLQLNKYQFTRDCFAYFVALAVFMCSVGANFEHTFKRTEWGHCLQVTVVTSVVLVGAQLLYCVLVAKFLDILKFLGVEEEDVRATVRLTLGEAGAARVSVTYRNSINNQLLNDKNSLSDAVVNMENQSNGDAMEREMLSMTNRDTITIYNAMPDKKLLQHRMFEVVSNATLMVLTPFRLAIEWTVPDVREEGKEGYYGGAIFVCIMWLAVFAYALCECLTILGQWLNIPAVIMGLTFSAVGTSFPNLWCSLVVARNGQGDMAVSNALGSNTFNILVALGLPWLIFTSVNYPNVSSITTACVYYVFKTTINLLCYRITISFKMEVSSICLPCSFLC